MITQQPPIVMEEVTEAEELAQAHAQDERFDRNFAWFQAHATEIFTRVIADSAFALLAKNSSSPLRRKRYSPKPRRHIPTTMATFSTISQEKT